MLSNPGDDTRIVAAETPPLASTLTSTSTTPGLNIPGGFAGVMSAAGKGTSVEAVATSRIGSPSVGPMTEGRLKTPATSTLVSTNSVAGPPGFRRAAGISASDGMKRQFLTA